jgi:hypothetical protein
MSKAQLMAIGTFRLHNYVSFTVMAPLPLPCLSLKYTHASHSQTTKVSLSWSSGTFASLTQEQAIMKSHARHCATATTTEKSFSQQTAPQ